MKSSRSRSRNKNRNNRPSGGNVINRVFDSSGPEGKVRGTPQQIIDKYNQLARDAQLGNDRVAAENFQQHAEHYLRLLSEAQREMEARREEQDRQNRERQAEQDRKRAERQERESNAPAAVADPGAGDQPDVSDSGDGSGLVETPEENARPKRSRTRKPREPQQTQEAPAAEAEQPPAGDAPEAAE